MTHMYMYPPPPHMTHTYPPPQGLLHREAAEAVNRQRAAAFMQVSFGGILGLF